MDAVNIPAKFEVRSFTRSWDNRGYSKKLGRPWICPRSLFSKIFHGLVFGWTKSEDVGLIVRAISFPRFPTYVILIHQRHRQTDGRHAISIPRYALVHRAVIKLVN